MSSTNYVDTFIAVAPDTSAERGTIPKEGTNPSVSLRTFRMIREHPYEHTSDDVIFAVHADRNAIAGVDRPAARDQFFAKPQACLRASDLAKRYGWGIHHDGSGRVALYGMETPEYATLTAGKPLGDSPSAVTVTHAMRSSRR